MRSEKSPSSRGGYWAWCESEPEYFVSSLTCYRELESSCEPEVQRIVGDSHCPRHYFRVNRGHTVDGVGGLVFGSEVAFTLLWVLAQKGLLGSGAGLGLHDGAPPRIVCLIGVEVAKAEAAYG